MKRLSSWILASLALALAAPPLLADGGAGRRTRVLHRASPDGAGAPRFERKATAAAYSAQVNIVTRVQGTSFFKTAIDITNNTEVDGVVALVQYCYSVNNVFQNCTEPLEIALLSLDNFHTDDMVDFLGAEGVIGPDARASSFGTMLVTFENVPSAARMGRHRHGAHLQRLPGQPGARHPRDRLSRLALLRVGERHARRNDPRHDHGPDRRGRPPDESRRHEHGFERPGRGQRGHLLLRRHAGDARPTGRGSAAS